MTPLQPLDFPLWGSRLIEASAGTGKTWTIAALYLRLVLGHGGDAGFVRPLQPDEILVMTFTRAATRELSDRIRSRLLEAARCFRAEQAPDPADSFMAGLLDSFPAGPARSAAAWRLALAAEGMDDAAVFTIDAWCQRMLREHAFDSGSLFDEELAADESALQQQAATDYWRTQVYPLTGPALAAVLAVWPDVQVLIRSTGPLLALELPPDGGRGTLAAALVAPLAQLQALKAGWAQRAAAMREWIADRTDGKTSAFNKVKLQARYYRAWLDTLAAWADDPAAERPDLSDVARQRLSPAGMHEALKDPASPIDWPDHFEAFEQLLAALESLPPLAGTLRLHAAASVQRQLAELKAAAGTFGFADLLTRLDSALDPDRNGYAALRLRDRILAQTPAALVDEFQDTAPVQLRIFDRLYRLADNDAASALVMIGDPKQAIYGFRGADIHSYLSARQATDGRHYALGTNHRSTAALVAAVNQVFHRAEQRPGEGAFGYRDVSGANPVPFHAVAARGRPECFVNAAGTAPALTLMLDVQLTDGGSHRQQFAALCAEQIVALLNDGQAGFDDPDTGWRRLQPADIAVLVRTRHEAAAVRWALRQRRVASVYLSDQDSVLASDQARDLLHWLRAVASPLEVHLVRAALATATAGLSLAELQQLASDDLAFDLRSEQLRQWHGIWQTQGVLAMLRQALHTLDLPARWLGAQADADGERRLTNVLHLAELLQAASAGLDGEQALIRWLARQIEQPAGRSDDQILRLESDADLVKLVTVHKAKGLEYPLVFLPFPCSFRGKDKARTDFVDIVDADGQRRLQLDPTPEQVIAADQDRLREDLRLLYVALTRARHALWVGLAALKIGNNTTCVWHRSGIGQLVSGAGPMAPEALEPHVRSLMAGSNDIVLQAAAGVEAIACTRLLQRAAAPALRLPQPYTAQFDRRWSIASFSALVRALPVIAPLAVSAATLRDDEADNGDPLPAARQPWHRFPRGAVPGNFLHAQLEWLAGERFGLADSAELRSQLQRRCERQGWGDRAPEALEWLGQVVTTNLPTVGAALADIAITQPELEFWFPSDGLATAALDRLCRQHLLNGRDRPELPERALHGMLMGFADLVFEHGGRYWVLDYKSNFLGPADADYDAAALDAAMAEHRYDVQAAIYLLALHRLLQTRLGSAYCPALHLGGAVFFFLRGLRGPRSGCCHVAASPALLAGLESLLTRALP